MTIVNTPFGPYDPEGAAIRPVVDNVTNVTIQPIALSDPTALFSAAREEELKTIPPDIRNRLRHFGFRWDRVVIMYQDWRVKQTTTREEENALTQDLLKIRAMEIMIPFFSTEFELKHAALIKTILPSRAVYWLKDPNSGIEVLL